MTKNIVAGSSQSDEDLDILGIAFARELLEDGKDDIGLGGEQRDRHSLSNGYIVKLKLKQHLNIYSKSSWFSPLVPFSSSASSTPFSRLSFSSS